MKQTAVEWLVEEMIERKYFARVLPLSYTTLEHLVNQAKQMEKEQIMDAFEDGYGKGYRDNGETAEQYYNENYKSVAHPIIKQLEQISYRDNPRIDRNLLLKFFKAGNDCGCMEHENIEDYFEQYFRL